MDENSIGKFIQGFFYGLPVFRLPLVRTLCNWLSDFLNLLGFFITGNRSFTGGKRLFSRIHKLLRKNDVQKVYLSRSEIGALGGKYKRLRLPARMFLPRMGIVVEPENGQFTYNQFKLILCKGLSESVDRYFKKKAFSFFSIGLYALVLFFSVKFTGEAYNAYYLGTRFNMFLLDILWICTNLFFFFQLYLYNKIVLWGEAQKPYLTEAAGPEVKDFLSLKDTPDVLVLIPVCREEPLLIKRILFCHLLQYYRSIKVVMLLDRNVTGNENEVYLKVAFNEFKDDVREQRGVIEGLLDQYSGDSEDRAAFLLQAIERIIQWINKKEAELKADEADYPFDSFLYESVFDEITGYWKELSGKLEKASADWESGTDMEEIRRRVKNFFSISMELFARHDYKNLNHELTKSANLESYRWLINKKFIEEPDCQTGGKLIKVIGDSPVRFVYIAVLDADVIVKPDYLVKKVLFLEKPENSIYGLIQSPYIVPEAESTRIARAAGVHNDWFYPYSLGLNSCGSVFWLGYNGLFRAELLNIPGFFAAQTAVEDMEITLKIKQGGYDLFTSLENNCMTFSPSTLRSLEIQRKRWSSGSLKIFRIFLKDMFNGVYRGKDRTEIQIRILYILNLNLLPVFSTLLYFIVLSASQKLGLIMVVPWFVFMAQLFANERVRNRYKKRSVFDSQLLYFFMNSYHLRGLLRSVFNFFIRERKFRSTPKEFYEHAKVKTNSGKIRQIKIFEIFQIILLNSFFIIVIIRNILSGQYWEVFPFYYLAIINGSLLRLVGLRQFFYSIWQGFIGRPLCLLAKTVFKRKFKKEIPE
ncbi:MAG: glycosyltransferase [Spirochaetales bacterium]|nr:glycosyltransferase [Spirochaetales bacterium]